MVDSTTPATATHQITGDVVTNVEGAPKSNSTFSYIDGYCERGGQPGPFAEPLNLITNLAFVIGALLILKLLITSKQIVKSNWDIILLTFVLALIGFGSGAYHSMPSKLTVNFDVIPIALFIHIYLVSFFIRMAGMKPIPAFIVLILFIGVGILFENNFSRDTLNGTIMYVPTYLMMILMVMVLGFIKQNPLYLHLVNTAVIWTFSLAFRTMDLRICEHTMHNGTHFLWHTLNAIVLYRMLKLLILNKFQPKDQPEGREVKYY